MIRRRYDTGEDDNGNAPECGIQRQFDIHVRDFDEHRQDMLEWRDSSKSVFEKVNVMNEIVQQMHEDTQHLNVLPTICKEMEKMRWIVLALSAVLCIIFVLREVGDRNLKVGPGSFEITTKAANASNDKN